MTTVFADAFYFLALLDSREERHSQAAQVARDPQLRIVTTEWVLAEFGDAYCHPNDRADFVLLYRSLQNHPRVKIVPADTRLFQRGVDLFEQRPDKEWSLTDCLSFAVMRDEGISQALTGDRHLRHKLAPEPFAEKIRKVSQLIRRRRPFRGDLTGDRDECLGTRATKAARPKLGTRSTASLPLSRRRPHLGRAGPHREPGSQRHIRGENRQAQNVRGKYRCAGRRPDLLSHAQAFQV